MKDLASLMQQAQGMQQKLQDAQARIAEITAEGRSGGGLVSVVLKGSGELVSVRLDDSLLVPTEGEIVSDLLVAAHADARAKLEAVSQKAMEAAMGPMAGMMGGLPKMGV